MVHVLRHAPAFVPEPDLVSVKWIENTMVGRQVRPRPWTKSALRCKKGNSWGSWAASGSRCRCSSPGPWAYSAFGIRVLAERFNQFHLRVFIDVFFPFPCSHSSF